MDMPHLREALGEECRRLCERYGLTQAYVVEIVGLRRHYLAGYGRPTMDKPEHLPLSEKIALFWHGTVPAEEQAGCTHELQDLAERWEKEALSGKSKYENGKDAQ